MPITCVLCVCVFVRVFWLYYQCRWLGGRWVTLAERWYILHSISTEGTNSLAPSALAPHLPDLCYWNSAHIQTHKMTSQICIKRFVHWDQKQSECTITDSLPDTHSEIINRQQIPGKLSPVLRKQYLDTCPSPPILRSSPDCCHNLAHLNIIL